MNIKKLICEYLEKARMMQIATVNGDQPWNCTVYFAADESLNLYWISKPETRHSREIAKNPKVGVAIPVKFDDFTVVGVQLEGDAMLVESVDEIKLAVRIFTDKHNRGEDWYQDFLAENNPHKLYRIKPRRFVIFDRVNFPEDPYLEWTPK